MSVWTLTPRQLDTITVQTLKLRHLDTITVWTLKPRHLDTITVWTLKPRHLDTITVQTLKLRHLETISVLTLNQDTWTVLQCGHSIQDTWTLLQCGHSNQDTWTLLQCRHSNWDTWRLFQFWHSNQDPWTLLQCRHSNRDTWKKIVHSKLFSENEKCSSFFANGPIKFKNSTMQPLKALKLFEFTRALKKKTLKFTNVIDPFAKKLENLNISAIMLWLDNLLPSFPAKQTQKLHTDDMSLARIWLVLLIGWCKFSLSHDQSEALPRSALFPHVSFYGETSTGVAKCWLIYQPDERAKCLQYFDSLNFLINVPSFLAQQTTSNTTLARAFKFKLLACFIY